MKALCATIGASIMVTILACVPASVSAGPVPTWDEKIDKPARFKVLKAFNDEAVLDKETGLVWERKPDPLAKGSWPFIDNECFANFTGKRLGWRPPTAEELLSLMDPTNNFTGKLPTDHPFEIGPGGREALRTFWTITSDKGLKNN